MLQSSFCRDRGGAVSVLFAGAAIPMIGFLGLAIDFAFLNQAKSQLQLAASTAALSATKVASNEFILINPLWQTDATTNGQQWFAAQLSQLADASYNPPTVQVTRNGTAFSSTVGYVASVPTHFAGLFGFNSFPVSGSATANITVNGYVNIEMMLDNSSSMLIASSSDGVNAMQAITACSPMSSTSNQGTGAWSGTLIPKTCPTTYTTTANTNVMPPVAGQAPHAAPCGFACHWSNNKQTLADGITPDYTQYDYYYLSQHPEKGAIMGYPKVQLRFDVVQSATAAVIQQMQAQEVLSDQFGLGVFEFGSKLTQVYPPDGTEASTDLVDGQAAVTAINTPVVTNNGDTDFPDAMVALAGKLTPAGDGAKPSSPTKNLFIVTDGMQDYGSRAAGDTMGPFGNAAAIAACNAIKHMGINIYVLYTPYTPLPNNPFYAGNISQFVVTPPNPNKIVTALESCATAATDFYEADLPSQIQAAMVTMLQAAIKSPARYSSL